MVYDGNGIKLSKDLGKLGSGKYACLPCEHCGELRWVRISSSGIARSHYCRSCGCSLSRLKNSIGEKNKDLITHKYMDNKQSACSIAKELSISTSTVTSKLTQLGITLRPNTTTLEEKKIVREQWVKNNPNLRRQYTRTSNRRLKTDVLTHYSIGEPKCVSCGITDTDVLCLDHINGGGEAHRRTIPHGGAGLHLYLWIKKNNYPNLFQVLCLNCNWKKHLKSLES
jgi:hypothetical protein